MAGAGGQPPETIRVLDHGFVRLDGSMASDLSVVNGARVSFARRKEEMDESDEGLIRFLMRDRHGTPFEHNAFRFHIRCPIFVAREWMRHRVGCLTGDTVVTFVNNQGETGPALRKTIDELWAMWERGERNGHSLTREQRQAVDGLAAAGRSVRSISRELNIGRRGIASYLRGENEYRDSRWRVRRMRLRVLNEATNEFGIGHIADIVDKGIQPVYRLMLADGRNLTLTENHRLLTVDGWMTLREAVGLVGNGRNAVMTRKCVLMTNGAPAHQDREWLEARRKAGKSVRAIAEEAGCSYHTIRKWLARHDLRFTREERYRSRTPWNKGVRGYRTGMIVTEGHREVIRRARSGPHSNFWRGGVTPRRASTARWTREQAPRVHLRFGYTCQVCGRRGGRLHAHHVVPVWLDSGRERDPENLVSVCASCHPMIHRTRESELSFMEELSAKVHLALPLQEIPVRKGWKLTAHAVEVAGIQYLGPQQTYDLCVNGPWHNFVANGVVVHNSFNEFSMRYAKASDDFYVPEPEDVRTQVGKPGAYSFEPVDPDVADQTRDELRAVYEAAFAAYERLVELGVARELARCVMPVGAYTEFYWTINARSLMNFVSLRAAETAQREIRRYAEAIEQFFADKMPVTHAAFVANDRTAP
jgi:thymidylate synthase (FAD)